MHSTKIPPIRFTAAELVEVSADIQLYCAPLLETIRSLVERLDAHDQLIGALRTELDATTASARSHEERLNLLAPDTAGDALSDRIGIMEADISALRGQAQENQSKLDGTALLAQKLGETIEDDRAALEVRLRDLSDAHIPQLDAAIEELDALKRAVAGLDDEISSMDDKIIADRQDLAEFKAVASRDIRALSQLFCVGDLEDLSKEVEAAPTAKRIGIVHSLPWFAIYADRVMKERQDDTAKLRESIESVADRVKEKTDLRDHDRLKRLLEDFTAEVRSGTEQLRGDVKGLEDHKADKDSTLRSLQSLGQEKADRSELATKMGNQDMQAMYSALEAVKDNVGELWERVAKAGVGGKSAPAQVPRQPSPVGGSAADVLFLDELKRRTADCERSIRVLAEEKADRADLRALQELIRLLQQQGTSIRVPDAVIVPVPPSGGQPPRASTAGGLNRGDARRTTAKPGSISAPPGGSGDDNDDNDGLPVGHTRIDTGPVFKVEQRLTAVDPNSTVVSTALSPPRNRVGSGASSRTGSPGNSFHLARAVGVRDARGSLTSASITAHH
eukprot:PhM_4_TR1218/c0_g1_i1/m.72433